MHPPWLRCGGVWAGEGAIMESDEPGPVGGSSVSYEDCDTPLGVKPRSFYKFSRSIDRQLAKLVLKWAHWAAPNALRGRLPWRRRR
jgi:hypothetical protein